MHDHISRVATALLIDYSSVYYIDRKTGHYECYSTNAEYQKLELHSSGENFFEDCQRDIRLTVYEEDREMVSKALSRESLLNHLSDTGAISLVYRLVIDGEIVYYSLRILQDEGSDGDYLILGARNVDEAVRTEQATRTYNAIAKTLANRYATIYYVDMRTDHYVEYSSSNDYKELEVPPEGSDFFAESRQNILRVIHPEDQDKLVRALDKAYMASVTDNGRKYRLEYRLIMSDGAHYMRLTAVRTDDGVNLIVALDNIDDEVKSKQEMKAISEKNMVFSQIAESLAPVIGEEARWEAGLMLAHVLGCDPGALPAHREDDLSLMQQAELSHMLERRLQRKPLQYILGEWAFMGLPIRVRPGALIPRQDTEILCEKALALAAERNYETALDLCCGTGCIGIALQKLGGLTVTAADVDPGCVALTEKNAAWNRAEVTAVWISSVS